MLAENLQRIEERIRTACERAGRAREDVTLIAVSKTKPLPMLEEIYAEGMRNFGENKVQEILEKKPNLPDDINWHMIGHLQRNKVKAVIDKVTLIHSVDSMRLAETIEQEAAKKDIVVDILLEVNVADEDSKYGFKCHEVLDFACQIAKFPHVHIIGLMTIAPFVDNPEDNRKVFAELKKLSVDIAKKNIDNISVKVLSMGMTNDFEVAIEEGATMIRVGTAIFGEREYNI